MPASFAHTSASGAPWVGSVAQSVLAVIVVVGFAIAGDALGGAEAMFGDMAFLFPVLTMFTWLTNTGAAGLVLLMGLTAFAVIGYFRRNSHGLNVWVRVIAPAISGVLLVAMFVMILGNFQLMLGQTEPDATTFILPGLIIAALAAGIVWALVLRKTKPSIYRQIGHGTEPGAYGTEMLDVVDSQ